MGAMPGQLVDHINGNGLDCRRENLRLCTAKENAHNRKPWAKAKISKFKGVTRYHPRRPGWDAQICSDGKVLYLGHFATEEEAARAYDSAARDAFGDFALLNFQVAA
jgi:hypothetical protein